MRGKHNNQPRKLTAVTGDEIELVVNHIRSYKGRSSHYSQNKTTLVYLTEVLNITKMFEQLREQSPASTTFYESYRKIFNNKFNISFGYPKSDTCSTCDDSLQNLHAWTLKSQQGTPSFSIYFSTIHYHFPYPSPFSLCC